MRSLFSDPPRWLSLAATALIGGAGAGLLLKTEGVTWTVAGVVAVITAALLTMLYSGLLRPRQLRRRIELLSAVDAPAE